MKLIKLCLMFLFFVSTNSYAQTEKVDEHTRIQSDAKKKTIVKSSVPPVPALKIHGKPLKPSGENGVSSNSVVKK